MTDVRVEGVSVTLDGTTIVHEVSFTTSSSRWLSLIGPNGAGKTTLLRVIAGLQKATGTVRIGKNDAEGMSARDRARAIAFVPQRPVIPEGMTVNDYVLMGRTPYVPYFGTESHEDLAIVAGVLETLELVELGDRLLGSLSGGELQRVVLGRALAQQAPVLLLDEPTSALDVGHQQQMLELVDALRAARGLTVIAAMHDLSLAAQFGEDLVLMNGGRVVASGSPAEVLTEDAIQTHYGARVRIIEDADGVHVLTLRSRAGTHS